MLALHFVAESARELGKTAPSISPHLVSRLVSYSFPRHVRELKSMIFDAVSRSDTGALSTQHLPAILKGADEARAGHASSVGDTRGISSIKETVDRLVDEALKTCGGNRTAAARLLGITPQALGQRLKKTKKSREEA